MPSFGQYTGVRVILPVLVKPLRGTGCLEAHFDVFLSVEGTRGQAQGLPLQGLLEGGGVGGSLGEGGQAQGLPLQGLLGGGVDGSGGRGQGGDSEGRHEACP